MSEAVKDEFENTTNGHIGVIQRVEGKLVGRSVRPKDTVWLDEEEQVATANAPKRNEDNPLFNGMLRKTASGDNLKGRRPLAPPPPEELSEEERAAQEAEAQRQQAESAEMKRLAEQRAAEAAEAASQGSTAEAEEAARRETARKAAQAARSEGTADVRTEAQKAGRPPAPPAQVQARPATAPAAK